LQHVKGAKARTPFLLERWQKAVVGNLFGWKRPDGTRRYRECFLFVPRKNGKTALIAALLLAFICGPEAKLNAQILSAANSRDQAALVFNLAQKMIYLNPELEAVCKIIPSSKRIHGITMNTEYRASSADASTAHGASPLLIIADEVGQSRLFVHFSANTVSNKVLYY